MPKLKEEYIFFGEQVTLKLCSFPKTKWRPSFRNSPFFIHWSVAKNRKFETFTFLSTTLSLRTSLNSILGELMTINLTTFLWILLSLHNMDSILILSILYVNLVIFHIHWFFCILFICVNTPANDNQWMGPSSSIMMTLLALPTTFISTK